MKSTPILSKNPRSCNYASEKSIKPSEISKKCHCEQCDTLDGPVIQDARIALEKGDVTPVLKWVKKEAESEIRATFDKALLDRKINKETADMKFFEC